MASFRLQADYELKGDQPEAVAKLAEGLRRGDRFQTLLGVTGSGKTFTMANLIAQAGKPTLVMAPNKTLAAQLCNEFREFLPDNAVEYFVSYYDYYQPEAYLPATDTYIEKDSSINQEIDRLRHAATSDLLMRDDVVIVASVSCIYGLGSPQEYLGQVVLLKQGDDISRDEVFAKLVKIHYERNDIGFTRGKFRVRGESFEVWPAYDDYALRVSLWGDLVEEIVKVDPLTQEVVARLSSVAIYPATHFVTSEDAIERSLAEIATELETRVAELEAQGKQLEAFRLRQRTQYDMEMLRELGYCNGIENYSRILAGRQPGEPPYTLLDFFPDDFLVLIDESHMTVPQLHGMYEGDRSRKTMLVEHGFRLPSALDNRPLRFDEFIERAPQLVFVSATPGEWEMSVSTQVVEQLVRPTGLVDPVVEVRPTKHQIDNLMNEIRVRVDRGQRTLVTTLTKKMAEDLTDYLLEMGFRVRYLHSEVDTIERIRTVRELRLGEVDVLVGINLLREGLDLPEVTLVAILDADKEGFPARRDGPHPDHRQGGAERRRQGHHVRRQAHKGDGPGYLRDGPPPGGPAGLQRGARHRAAHHRQGRLRHRRTAGYQRVRPLQGAAQDGARRGDVGRGDGAAHGDAGRGDVPGGRGTPLRVRGQAPRRDQGPGPGPGPAAGRRRKGPRRRCRRGARQGRAAAARAAATAKPTRG